VRRGGVQAHRRPPLQRRVRAAEALALFPPPAAEEQQRLCFSNSPMASHIRFFFLNTPVPATAVQGASAELDGGDAGDLGGDGGGRPHRVSARAFCLPDASLKSSAVI
jgi:hypothetical protein